MSASRPLRPHDPKRIADYTLTDRLGDGGQGVVYLGSSPSGEQVAVKVLHRGLTEDADARRYFEKELAAAKRVAPFCTARVLASGLEEGQFYIVSEYVAGPSLREVVIAEGPRSGSNLDRLAVATLAALGAIHQANVVHCDLKPANILIGPDGPRLIDFGIARALQETTSMTSGVVGTPHYVAPEQLSGDPIGPPADMFAWAGTMLYAATGKPPFGSGTIPAVINRVLQAEPNLDSLTGPFRTLLAECFSKDPSLRPTAEGALKRLMAGTSAFPAAASPGAPKAEPALAATLLVLFLVRPHRPGSTNPPQSPAASSALVLAQPQVTVTVSLSPASTSPLPTSTPKQTHTTEPSGPTHPRPRA